MILWRGRWSEPKPSEVDGDVDIGAEVAQNLGDPGFERGECDILSPVNFGAQVRNRFSAIRGDGADAANLARPGKFRRRGASRRQSYAGLP